MENQKDPLTDGESFHGYRVERLLGKGGLGAVYLVRHEMLDTLFALKVLYPEVAEKQPEYVKRFLREAKLATRIRHPNLVAVHDCGRDSVKGFYYLVMDYVQGSDLRTAMAFGGKMKVEEAVRIVAETAAALSAVQPLGVVHRDIKPENIMLQEDGSVKLVDLGVAKATNLGDSLRTTTGNVFGTPSYISPEQATSAADVDCRADIYSLGIVFFEMLSGRCPYTGKNAAQILTQILNDDPTPDVRDYERSVPPLVATLIRRMSVKDRNRRISDFGMLLTELKKLGYPLGAADGGTKQAQYAPAGEATAPLSFDPVHPPKANNTLSFETQDEEIQKFVSDLKTKRQLKRMRIIEIIGALVILILVALLVFGR